MNQLDRLDWAILEAMQADASLSAAELGARVGLSATPCWKRVKRLEDAGVIERRVAIVNRERVAIRASVKCEASAHPGVLRSS